MHLKPRKWKLPSLSKIYRFVLRPVAALSLLIFLAPIEAREVITYYHNDTLGSPVAMTDQNGSLCWREDYKPYGEKIYGEDQVVPANPDCGLDENKRGYTNHIFDHDIGLTYMQARYYDPVVGRFISVDPIGFTSTNSTSFNRYAYGNNNPYLYVDPDGRAASRRSADGISSGIGNPLSLPFGGGGGVVPTNSARNQSATPSNSNTVSNPPKSGESYYRYIGETEAAIIRSTGRIPNVDRAGNVKDVYFTNRLYETAGRAKAHNQLPNTPSYRVEINPKQVREGTAFSRVNPTDNPKWGVGGGVEATTRHPIVVDPNTLVRLKGAP